MRNFCYFFLFLAYYFYEFYEHDVETFSRDFTLRPSCQSCLRCCWIKIPLRSIFEMFWRINCYLFHLRFLRNVAFRLSWFTLIIIWEIFMLGKRGVTTFFMFCWKKVVHYHLLVRCGWITTLVRWRNDILHLWIDKPPSMNSCPRSQNHQRNQQMRKILLCVILPLWKKKKQEFEVVEDMEVEEYLALSLDYSDRL